MDNRAIGVYDSGIGGLTGLKALKRLMPGENYIYFADTGRMPYGQRSEAELCKIARQDMDFLRTYNIKAILAACGTISSAAHTVIENYDIPAFGVVGPSLDAMAAVPGQKPLAVIATDASIKSGEFTEALKRRCPDRKIIGLACTEFAPIIEAGHIDPNDPLLQKSIERTLAPLKSAEFSAMLLACTHYGIIETAIRDYLGDVRLMSASDCSAAVLKDYLSGSGQLSDRQNGGSIRYFVSGSPEPFEKFAESYLECGPVHAERVPIMEL